MRVYIHILTWNDLRYLPDLFESLENQTHADLTVRILDNGSTDGTVEYLRQYYPRAFTSRNTKNVGFAEGHNQLVRYTLDHLLESEIDDSCIIWMNPDMILDPDAIKNLVQEFEKDKTIGALQPKLYRAFGENLGDEVLEETIKSDILDTTGLSVGRSWRMTDRGAGEMDKGQFDELTDIFAPSGTMALLNIRAIRNVMINNEMFDKDFFAYREDCDFAWRFRKNGWKAKFVPGAKAYHYRGMYGADKQSLWQRLTNRKSQSPFFAAYSTRNQLFVLIKNLTIGDLVVCLPWILTGELGRVGYSLIFEPQTRNRLLSGIKLIPKMLSKRKSILSNAKVKESELRKYVRN